MFLILRRAHEAREVERQIKRRKSDIKDKKRKRKEIGLCLDREWL